MRFPPIFALSIFFIFDTLELIFYFFVFTAPAAVFLSMFCTMLYMAWVLQRYGIKSGKEKLFKVRGVKASKVLKKFIKFFGGAVIPFVNTWAVWDDYMEEGKESEEKNNNKDNNQNNKKENTASENDFTESDKDNLDNANTERGKYNDSQEEVIEKSINNDVQRENPIERIEAQRREKKLAENIAKSQKDNQDTDNNKNQNQNPNPNPNNNNRNKRFKTTAEILAGKELLPTSQEAFDTNYAGEKMIAVNDPSFYEENIKNQNDLKEEAEKVIKVQDVQRVKKSLAEELVQISRIRAEAVKRYGPNSEYVKRLKAKEDNLNPNIKNNVDELTIGKNSNPPPTYPQQTFKKQQ